MGFSIGISPNIRKSPFFDACVADGVAGFSVYNHMFIPTNFGDPDAEYDRLINTVAMWDVGAQRQVEVSGPDAAALVQYLCTRDLSRAVVGQGYYVPICRHDGVLINDPVLLKVADDRFWLSIADSDIGLWASAIAAERGWDAQVEEPDVSPLAVQGPRAEDVVAQLIGEWVRDLRYFGFRETTLDDIPLLVARSGWSKQGGFELYLRDSRYGDELWQRVKQAGAALGIGPGAPNDIERIESGLLSYGADGRLQVNPVNPFEVGLGKFVDLGSDIDFVGKSALQNVQSAGIKRRICGYFVAGDPPQANQQALPVFRGDEQVGLISEVTYSPRLQKGIALGFVSTEIENDSGGLSITPDDGARSVVPAALPFI
ncbi:MAG: glycine cleavage T C-terminal barrel domain-containing protein [Pseudomonadota bacterium]